MLVYLDMCCLKRPFDDQSQPRIHLESEAVLGLLAAESDSLRFVRALALWLENEQNPVPWRAAKVRQWLGRPEHDLPQAALEARTSELIQAGFANFDALHVGSAELSRADVFATCDDRLIATARRCEEALRVRVLGIMEVVREVLS